MSSHEIGDEVADDSVWSALAFCDDSGHECLCSGVPFEVDSSVDVGVGAVELGPAGASAGGLLAVYGEIVLFEVRVDGDGFSETAAAIAGYMNDALHFFNSCRRVMSISKLYLTRNRKSLP